jgi:hypothetical protein
MRVARGEAEDARLGNVPLREDDLAEADMREQVAVALRERLAGREREQQHHDARDEIGDCERGTRFVHTRKRCLAYGFHNGQ